MKFLLSIEEGDALYFLDISEIEFCHEKAQEGYPSQRTGTLNLGLIESALQRPFFYHEYENECDVVTLAAILWHGITQAHGFEDGNKRTGFLAMTVFLEANGVELVEVSSYPGRFIQSCFEKGDFSEETLEAFLRPRCRWIVD